MSTLSPGVYGPRPLPIRTDISAHDPSPSLPPPTIAHPLASLLLLSGRTCAGALLYLSPVISRPLCCRAPAAAAPAPYSAFGAPSRHPPFLVPQIHYNYLQPRRSTPPIVSCPLCHRALFLRPLDPLPHLVPLTAPALPGSPYPPPLLTATAGNSPLFFPALRAAALCSCGPWTLCRIWHPFTPPTLAVAHIGTTARGEKCWCFYIHTTLLPLSLSIRPSATLLFRQANITLTQLRTSARFYKYSYRPI
ncbi:hypothetical protein C8R44DRAFT_889515 [Mycena epipterygia]|nr:hypothetical protein C8R44DRAFT_889515 [Mycena epipterygia]